jgi:hypothetical protein
MHQPPKRAGGVAQAPAQKNQKHFSPLTCPLTTKTLLWSDVGFTKHIHQAVFQGQTQTGYPITYDSIGYNFDDLYLETASDPIGL